MVYINGKMYPNEEASVSVYDHGLLYGDGVFEGIRIYNGRVFRLEAHLRRLYASARAILLDIGMDHDSLYQAVLETVSASELKEGYIRLLVTRGTGSLGIDPAKCGKATVIVIVDTIALYPAEMYEQGIALVTASTRRMPPDCLDPRVKSLNYLNNILAKIEARQAGCQEAVMLNASGYVVECTVDNIFISDGESVYTPAVSDGALAGITRQVIIDLCLQNGLPCVEKSLTRYDLYNARELFLSGSGAEIIPAVKLDGRQIGDGLPGSRTRQIRQWFTEHVRY